MMKKMIFAFLLLLSGIGAQAQRIYIFDAPPWQGPVRFNMGGGMTTCFGQSSFRDGISDGNRELLSYANSKTPFYYIGFDMRSGNASLAFSAFFGLEYFKDGWTAVLPNPTPTWEEHYTMNMSALGGDFGFGVTSFFTDHLYAAFGLGFSIRGSLSLDYTSTAVNTVTGARIDDWSTDGIIVYDDESDFYFGLLAKLDVVYNLNDWFSVGMQARYDALPFYVESASTAFSNHVNNFQEVSNNGRNRLAILFNVGFTFLSGTVGGALR